jgi:hypothetical protein
MKSMELGYKLVCGHLVTTHYVATCKSNLTFLNNNIDGLMNCHVYNGLSAYIYLMSCEK